MSAIARPIPEAPAETNTRRPGLMPSTIFCILGVAMAASWFRAFALGNHGRRYDQADDGDTPRLGERGAREQDLQATQAPRTSSNLFSRLGFLGAHLGTVAGCDAAD